METKSEVHQDHTNTRTLPFFVCLFVCYFFFTFLCLFVFVCLFVCLFVYLFVSLFVFIFKWWSCVFLNSPVLSVCFFSKKISLTLITEWQCPQITSTPLQLSTCMSWSLRPAFLQSSQLSGLHFTQRAAVWYLIPTARSSLSFLISSLINL